MFASTKCIKFLFDNYALLAMLTLTNLTDFILHVIIPHHTAELAAIIQYQMIYLIVFTPTMCITKQLIWRCSHKLAIAPHSTSQHLICYYIVSLCHASRCCWSWYQLSLDSQLWKALSYRRCYTLSPSLLQSLVTKHTHEANVEVRGRVVERSALSLIFLLSIVK